MPATEGLIRATFSTPFRSKGDMLVLLKASEADKDLAAAQPLRTEEFPAVVQRIRDASRSGLVTILVNPDVSPDVHFRTKYVEVPPGEYAMAFDPTPPHSRIMGQKLTLQASKPTQPGQPKCGWTDKGLQCSWKKPLFSGGAADDELQYQVVAVGDGSEVEQWTKVAEVSGKTEVVVESKALDGVGACAAKSGKLGCVLQVLAKNPSVEDWSTGGWLSEPLSDSQV
eukprot:gnl/TRDRNA2_/TRDRNA2_130924_c0_seq1.p1 gnl/TRDRNA2_/TRDRNA2_130924_c0~~gnl/TRDRNA2_/TRDRNA2_130924_c0_seq1.p1  ORF type:complete len:239 (+),score=39.60 gnl/TRDRNA2_/TRDRNA2_130924_c0_seq1:40-717(+)